MNYDTIKTMQQKKTMNAFEKDLSEKTSTLNHTKRIHLQQRFEGAHTQHFAIKLAFNQCIVVAQKRV